MVHCHSFTEMSLSRSGYLIARQGDSTVYLDFLSEPLLLGWNRQFKSFSEGGTLPILLTLATFTPYNYCFLQVLLSNVGTFPHVSLWNYSTNSIVLFSLVREFVPESSTNCVIMVWVPVSSLSSLLIDVSQAIGENLKEPHISDMTIVHICIMCIGYTSR